jgi:hypothetical protein
VNVHLGGTGSSGLETAACGARFFVCLHARSLRSATPAPLFPKPLKSCPPPPTPAP